MTSVKLYPGKADFVKRVNPATGKATDVCLLEWNADLSNGCIAQVYKEHLTEVIENHGLYAKGNFAKYKELGTADGRCDYCYAWRKNSGSVAPKTVDTVTRECFEMIKPRFLRIGKSSEPGHSHYSAEFLKLIYLCAEFGTRPIITTKMLSYEDRVAQALKDSNASLLFSLGFDQIEPGAVNQGFSNRWRIEQALKYHESGVNTSLTVVCDVTDSIEENTSRGSSISAALEEKVRTGINVRIIPARLYTHKSSMVITGARRKFLTDSGHHKTLSLFPEEDMERESSRYRWEGRLKAVSNTLHQDFLKLISDGMGICGATAGIERCDKCNCYGQTRIEFPESELPEIDFNAQSIGKSRLRSEKRRKEREELKKQTLLFALPARS